MGVREEAALRAQMTELGSKAAARLPEELQIQLQLILATPELDLQIALYAEFLKELHFRTVARVFGIEQDERLRCAYDEEVKIANKIHDISKKYAGLQRRGKQLCEEADPRRPQRVSAFLA
jgi:hypothetical protein